MTPLWSAALTGFLTSFALILAIGAQNAFVLKQGLQRAHVFWVALTCALSDAILITAGVAGFGIVILAAPELPRLMALAGGAFLVFYGLLKFRDAAGANAQQTAGDTPRALFPTLLTTLALTWLNPHVYLDTLGLIGAVSTRFEGIAGKAAFTAGAVSASFVFFFSLAYGARFLAPLLKTPRTWQILDILIGLLMLWLAAGLFLSA